MDKATKILYYVEEILENLQLAEDVTSPKGILALEATTYKAIEKATKQHQAEALKRIYRVIDKVNPKKEISVKAGIKQIQEIIKKFGLKVAPISSEQIYKYSEKLYKKVKKRLAEKIGTPYTFTQPDKVAIGRVNKYQNIFIGNNYKNKVTKRVKRIIVKTIKENETLSRDAIARELKKQMPDLMKQKGHYKTVVGQVLNNSRSYSNMRYYSDAGIERYQVLAIIDERTSSQCKYMDGTILEVKKTLDNYKLFDKAKSIEDVKNVNPWIDFSDGMLSVKGKALTGDLTGEDLQAMGLNASPYHSGCRTTVIPVL